jgi:hypothetical protein
MGLDQYAHAIDNNGEREELAYWRKHPNLQGWMENLWHNKGCPGRPEEPNSLGMSDFNCIPIELDHSDLDNLEQAIDGNKLPSTEGFFFGGDSDDIYKEQDLDFVRKARQALDSGLIVEYISWW